MQIDTRRAYPPLEAQIPTVDAVWNWSERQSPAVSMTFRVILAHMAQSSCITAGPLVERVAFSFDDCSKLKSDAELKIDAECLDEIIRFLAAVKITTVVRGLGGLCPRQSALLDLVKARSVGATGSADYWLVCGGQWAFVLLEPAARLALCRIAQASLTTDVRVHSPIVKDLGLAIFEAGMRREGQAMTLEFLTVARTADEEMDMAVVLSSLEKAAVIKGLVFSPPPPARPRRATFSPSIRPSPD